jgi:Na+-translocating ferredoxin:NAD+ oxidoreductase RnfD subunit
VQIRGRRYPIVLPTLRDPRLHLAAVIVSLQVLGQVSFGFRLSIAQILIALLTAAVLEFGIALRRQQVIMWPASALLTGNGVAFVLRVPGTQHGQWWSLRGWWIFAAAAAVSLLSKHVIRVHGRHVFNPSNLGLVLCFLVLGVNRAEPLDFWWAPMSAWMGLALGIIVAGGLVILLRLRLLEIAAGFWLAFAAGLGVLAASGHAMTAPWHLGPITGGYFWWLLVSSPELLVFLFFMITDPKTIPSSRAGRRAYALGLGLLAALLIAPQRTEFGSKVALLGALTLVCAARALVELVPGVARLPYQLVRTDRIGSGRTRRRAALALPLLGAAAFAGVLLLAGLPARSSAGAAAADATGLSSLPQVTIAHSSGVASQIDRQQAAQIARDLVADLRVEAEALRQRDTVHAASAASGSWLAGLQAQIRGAATHGRLVPTYTVQRISLLLEPGVGQAPPTIVAVCRGSVVLASYGASPTVAEHAVKPTPFVQTFELQLQLNRFRIIGSRGASIAALVPAAVLSTAAARAASARVSAAASRGFAGVRLTDVAKQVGLNFQQGAFRFGVDQTDPAAMMGGGLCWLDYNNDGWMDLFVVNSYAAADTAKWQTHGGLPRSALFENVRGRFVNVSAKSHADLAVRGNGCVAADLNGNGRTDLIVTTATGIKLLWNNGDGTFTEGARAAGIDSYGWHSGVAVADVNGDGRPDVFVAGYTNVDAPIPDSVAGFPTDHVAVCSLLYLNEGPDAHGHARFREVGAAAGLPTSHCDHSLGAAFSDLTGNGRPDLYVANDGDPNRLYLNVPWPGGAKADPKRLGFRLVDAARRLGVGDTNAGMGVAAADYDGDGSTDLFVSNSRGQAHSVFRGVRMRSGGPSFVDGSSGFAAAFGSNFTGWGASWVDLNRDGNLDLVLANGAIPVTNLAKNAAPVQVLENLSAQGLPGQFASAGALVGLQAAPRVNGRGLAAADFDNDGNVDIAINTIGGPLILLENNNSSGHWLEVSLPGFHPGAKVTAELPDGRKLVREVQAGSSYLSSEDPRLFFGLGSATTVRTLVVRYPGGKITRLSGIAANQILKLKP